MIGDRVARSDCRWCASNPLDDGVRSALSWPDTRVPETVSNYLAYLALPIVETGFLALAGARDDRNDEFFANVVVVAESVTIAGVLTQLVKYTAARERPFVHALPRRPEAPDPRS